MCLCVYVYVNNVHIIYINITLTILKTFRMIKDKEKKIETCVIIANEMRLQPGNCKDRFRATVKSEYVDCLLFTDK